MRILGIDAGGTLTKIVYREKERMHFEFFSSDKHREIVNWIKLIAPTHTLYITGGKKMYIHKMDNESCL